MNLPPKFWSPGASFVSVAYFSFFRGVFLACALGNINVLDH